MNEERQEPVWALIRKGLGNVPLYLARDLSWTKRRTLALTGSKKLMDHLHDTTRFKGVKVVDLTKREDME